MFSGFYSMIASINGEYVLAAWAILVATIFDMLDGRIARLAKATSQFGVEYDSLSDLVSFGMAPAILLYQWSLMPFDRLGWLASFLFMACGALRLARFNVTAENLPKAYFQGLPIPGAAVTVATYIIFSREVGWNDSQEIPALVLTFGLASLMVSTVRFPSFKEFNWRSRASSGYILMGLLAMIFIAIRPEVTLFFLMAGYILISLLWNLSLLLRKKNSVTELKEVSDRK